MKNLCKQLTEYYDTMYDVEQNEKFVKVRNEIYAAMDAYKASNPNASAVNLKSELHLQIANRFEPVLFDEFPFL